MNVMKIASLYLRQLSCTNQFILSRLLDVAFALSLALISKRNESKYAPFFSIYNFWIAMAFKG